MKKKRIAVFFGGRAPEHDVSVISGLQAFHALDSLVYEKFVVYVATDGRWFVGEGLDSRNSYLPDLSEDGSLVSVSLDFANPGRPRLAEIRSRRFARQHVEEFDVALLAFHGVNGEDGCMQGVFECAGVPYTGMRPIASSIYMSKHATKSILRDLDIPLLPHRMIHRPLHELSVDQDVLSDQIRGLAFPMCVKPVNLGSSIGVARVESIDELQATLPTIFRLDDQAMVEPFVPNLVEYNVSAMYRDGEVRTSAIEQPKRTDVLLDFRQKYQSGDTGKGKVGSKSNALPSEGMLSLTREINPELADDRSDSIRRWATTAFTAVAGTGAPRFDFLCNEDTGQIWFNEANPCPGSMGYFLWEAASPPLGFTGFLDVLIEEAVQCANERPLPADPVPVEARLLRRN